jgi:hypothetical protein
MIAIVTGVFWWVFSHKKYFDENISALVAGFVLLAKKRQNLRESIGSRIIKSEGEERRLNVGIKADL